MAIGIWLVIAIIFGLIGTAIGKGKGRAGAGWWLGFLLGIIGVIIIACMSETQEHKVQEAQRQYEVQAEAARRAGYQYPPQPYAPSGQAPYPQQAMPGQWQQPPAPGPWEQTAPGPEQARSDGQA
jgi:uncharacterized membrane protein YeaQ/YmgE (transglycosylase-associated protein family)